MEQEEAVIQPVSGIWIDGDETMQTGPLFLIPQGSRFCACTGCGVHDSWYMKELSEKESRGAGVQGLNSEGLFKKRVLSLSSLATKREKMFLPKHEETTVANIE